MAGVKVTDLTALGTAASDDILYIVDSSANASKKIEVQNIFDGMPQFASGTYSATVSGENFCSATVADGIYSRVGNVVTVSFRIETTVDTGETGCSFNINPPIASDFTSQKSFFATVTNSYDAAIIGSVVSDDTFDQLTIAISNVPTGPTPVSIAYIYITGQYEIV